MKTNLIGVIMIGGMLLSFTYYQSKPWAVPEKEAKMANPVKADAASLKVGKEMWTKHCAACHGKTGAGDGTKAASLKTAMEDMSKPAVQKLSDGELHYKIATGRDEMPSFKKKIPDSEDLWSIVNYMRTFKK
ncbi:c-type cytochrome [Solitalea sp. MAHUQ-68]|uniref:C-type cytochrome n=1 Tax=Solitalea agri TaxID=2953739 RepID=A0A9X2JDT2_9SPHI|nr:c-type cytochrome [Solitalea agri]MCO4291686.1 c-type cytochrome [Solitalea agri]